MRFLESAISLTLIIVGAAMLAFYLGGDRELPFDLFNRDQGLDVVATIAEPGFDEEALKRGVVHLEVTQRGFIGCLFGGQGAGTGFVIDRNPTQVVTAQHVVDGACSILVYPFGSVSGGWIESRTILHSDPTSDLAIIELERPPPHLPLTIGSSADLRESDTVCTVAYVKGGLQPPVKTCGRFLGRAACGAVTGLYFDADVLSGHSGAPLVNERGEVVGVVSQSAEAFFRGSASCAVPIELLEDGSSLQGGVHDSARAGAAPTLFVTETPTALPPRATSTPTFTNGTAVSMALIVQPVTGICSAEQLGAGDQALVIARRSQLTHQGWIDYLQLYPDFDSSLVGSEGYHQRWVQDYQLVINTLDALDERCSSLSGPSVTLSALLDSDNGLCSREQVGQADEAKSIAERAQRSHLDWYDYLLDFPDYDTTLVGSADHHQRLIQDYQLVIDVSTTMVLGCDSLIDAGLQ